jgi:hypothetical protein
MSLELDFRSVTKHRGSYDQYLTRYELAAKAAFAAGGETYKCFCRDLRRYMADERNLKSAAVHLRRYGGAAPGPDGIRLDDCSKIGL